MRLAAPVIGFFEVLIWLLAIGQIMQNLGNWTTYVAFAAGFACGNYIGIIIEGRLAMGICMVRFVLPEGAERLRRMLDRAGFRFTSFPARGNRGEVDVVITILRRRMLRNLQALAESFDPGVFYTVEDVRSARESRSLPLAWGTARRRAQLRKRK